VEEERGGYVVKVKQYWCCGKMCCQSLKTCRRNKG